MNMKNFNRLDAEQKRERIYSVFSCAVIVLIAFTFLFPLYWIITGSFKTKTEILSSTRWEPTQE